MYYKKLKALVDHHKLVIYTLLANPRTRSTAFYHAMKSMPDIDGGINEPFSTHDRGGVHYDFNRAEEVRKIRTFEDVCKNIYSVVEEILKTKQVARVWLHDHFYEILNDEMHHLLTLSRNVIVCIRDPRLQFLSFLIRVSNDKLATYRQSDLTREEVIRLFYKKEEGVSPEALLAFVDNEKMLISKTQLMRTINAEDQSVELATALMLSMETVLEYVQKEMDIMVKNTQFYLDLFKRYQEKSALNYAIVDAERLVDETKSQSVLQAATAQLDDLMFSENMINNWSQEDKVSMCWILENTQTPLDNAWNGPARTSTQFTTQHDVSGCLPLAVEQFPQAIQGVLRDALQLYHDCLTMSE